jgi:UDP-N-acetylglucosamine--N-acetylmuramyl-(pentapeptide) pyrophosphoryl-undecaprenol N-acetylglucosamine transferase
VARELQAHGIPIIWMGTKAGLEAKIIPAAGIEVAWLEVSGLRGKGWQALALAPFRLAKALWQSVEIMRKHQPAAVLGMGGFVAGPGGLVAALMGKPVVIHEQNAVAGLTNRLLAKFSKRVLEGFPNTFPQSDKVQVTGNPVRADIAALPLPLERLVDREEQPIHLLVVGGSLGAAALNQTVPQALALVAPHLRPEIRHQAGAKNLVAAQQAYQAAGVEASVTPFIEDMAEAYAWADLIICRAGALTVAEVSAAGLAALFIPYPYAVDDHQTANARYLVDQQAGLLLQQAELSPERLAKVLTELCTDRIRLLKMGMAARQLAMPYATTQVAAICAAYAGYDFQETRKQA